MPKINYLFPSHFFTIEQFKRSDIDQAFSIEEYDFCLSEISKTKTTHVEDPENYIQVSFNNYVLNDSKLLKLKNCLLEYVQNLTKNIYAISSDVNMQITTSWIVLGKKNQKSILHNHNNSFLSGILYLQANKKEDYIVFSQMPSVDRFALDISKPSKENPGSLLVQKQSNIFVNTGDILIFSSHTYHMIEPIKSNKDRLSLVFNIFPYGKIGSTDINFVDIKI